MVTLHDGKVMIIGGYPTYHDVLVFDQSNNGFTTGPSTLEGRHAACTLFNSPLHGNRPIVLAAGGDGLVTAEIYDYTITNEWQESKYSLVFLKQEFLLLKCTAMAPFNKCF